MSVEVEALELLVSVEVEALELLVRVAPIAVAAIADALDQGKSEADALAAARAHLPPRIDTRTEDLERRARVRMSHDVGGTSTPGSQAYALARLHGAGVAPWWALPEHVRIGWEHVAEHLQLPVAERTDEPTAKIGPARAGAVDALNAARDSLVAVLDALDLVHAHATDAPTMAQIVALARAAVDAWAAASSIAHALGRELPDLPEEVRSLVGGAS